VVRLARQPGLLRTGLTLASDGQDARSSLDPADKNSVPYYTSDVTDNVKCGPRTPGIPVSVTYRPQPSGAPEPLVVEFQEKK